MNMKLTDEDYRFFYRVISALMKSNKKEVAKSVLEWLRDKVQVKVFY